MTTHAASTYYEILGVDPLADTPAIKTAYRKLLRTVHPDAGGSGALFDLVSQAYGVLQDPARRASYDRSLTAPQPEAGEPPHPTTQDAQAWQEAAQAAHLAQLIQAAMAESRSAQAAADQAAREEEEARHAWLMGQIAKDRAAKKLWWSAWAPMAAAVLVGLFIASGWRAGIGGRQYVSAGEVFQLAATTTVRAWLLFVVGGALLTRRNGLAAPSHLGTAVVCAVWTAAVAVTARLPLLLTAPRAGYTLPERAYLPDLLVALVFLATIGSGVLARDGRAAGLRPLLCATLRESWHARPALRSLWTGRPPR